MFGAPALPDARSNVRACPHRCVDMSVAVLLRQAILEHLGKHKLVYENFHVLPKHHFAIHHPGQFARDGVVTD